MTKPLLPYPGVILAGGTSKRMGRDKARLKRGDDYLIVQLAQTLLDVLPEVTVLEKTDASLRHLFKDLPVRCLADEDPHRGPWEAIKRACHLFNPQAFFVVGCDMPGLKANLIRQIFKALKPQDLAVIPQANGILQSLCGVYQSGLLLREDLDRYHSPQSFFKTHLNRICVLKESDWKKSDPKGHSFENINTQEDFKGFLKARWPDASPFPPDQA